MYMQGFPYTLNSITVSAPVDVAVTIAQNRIDAELANQIMLADVLKNGGVTGDEPETKSYTPWLPVKPRVQQTHHRWFEEHTDGWAVIVFMENFGPLRTPEGSDITLVDDLDQVYLHLRKCQDDLRAGQFDRQIINALFQPVI